MRSSTHKFVSHGPSFRCRVCELLCDKDGLLEARKAPCIPAVGVDPFPSDVVCDVPGAVSVGGAVLHPSHRLAFWDLHGLYFCQFCGRTATPDGRQLVPSCQAPSRKGLENLGRIRKGLFPSYAGPSKASASLREARVLATAQQRERERARELVAAKEGVESSEA